MISRFPFNSHLHLCIHLERRTRTSEEHWSRTLELILYDLWRRQQRAGRLLILLKCAINVTADAYPGTALSTLSDHIHCIRPFSHPFIYTLFISLLPTSLSLSLSFSLLLLSIIFAQRFYLFSSFSACWFVFDSFILIFLNWSPLTLITVFV